MKLLLGFILCAMLMAAPNDIGGGGGVGALASDGTGHDAPSKIEGGILLASDGGGLS